MAARAIKAVYHIIKYVSHSHRQYYCPTEAAAEVCNCIACLLEQTFEFTPHGGLKLKFHLQKYLVTLLDFAVILQLLTVKKYSKIPYIWFTVNYCNTHCIMGISVLILQ